MEDKITSIFDCLTANLSAMLNKFEEEFYSLAKADRVDSNSGINDESPPVAIANHVSFPIGEFSNDCLWVTRKEMDERREHNLCLWCDEMYSHGHDCLQGKIFMIEFISDEELEEVEGGWTKKHISSSDTLEDKGAFGGKELKEQQSKYTIEALLVKRQNADGVEETSAITMPDYACQYLANAKEENKDYMRVEELHDSQLECPAIDASLIKESNGWAIALLPTNNSGMGIVIMGQNLDTYTSILANGKFLIESWGLSIACVSSLSISQLENSITQHPFILSSSKIQFQGQLSCIDHNFEAIFKYTEDASLIYENMKMGAMEILAFDKLGLIVRRNGEYLTSAELPGVSGLIFEPAIHPLITWLMLQENIHMLHLAMLWMSLICAF